MNATNAGVTPESGFTYANLFVFNSRDEEKGANGETVVTGNQAIMMDLNSFVWVSQKIGVLGDAVFSASATLPFANNSLSSDVTGPVSGGGGVADSVYQPLILGWRTERADLRAAFGFLAPTGRFTAGANNNVGSGYWTWVGSSGQTFYLTRNKATAVSAFQMYEFHTTQEGTGIHPGQTLNLDYSLTQILPLDEGLRLQLGLIGYAQWQTTGVHTPNFVRDHSLDYESSPRLPNCWPCRGNCRLRPARDVVAPAVPSLVGPLLFSSERSRRRSRRPGQDSNSQRLRGSAIAAGVRIVRLDSPTRSGHPRRHHTKP